MNAISDTDQVESIKPGLRERKRRTTRTSISQSALRLFAERGYDNVTVDEIAESCDVSPRTFFRYFGTKEEVLFAEGESRREHLFAALREQPDELDPISAIVGASKIVADHYVADRELLVIRSLIIKQAESLRARDAELPRQWDRGVVDMMRASGRADGLSELRLRVVVGASMTAFRVAIEEWIRSDTEDLHDVIDTAFACVGRGLGNDGRSDHD